MAQGTQVAPRFDAATVARLDALVVAHNAIHPGAEVDRAGLVRILVAYALPFVERETRTDAAAFKVRRLSDAITRDIRRIVRGKPVKRTAKRGRK